MSHAQEVKINVCSILAGKSTKEKNNEKDLDIDRRLILDFIHVVQDRDQWKGFCGHGDEASNSIKFWDLFY
jgi:exonuclease I